MILYKQTFGTCSSKSISISIYISLWYNCGNSFIGSSETKRKRGLEATRFHLRAENRLETGDVIEIHESIVLPRDIDKRRLPS
jgi:hypothetical protein